MHAFLTVDIMPTFVFVGYNTIYACPVLKINESRATMISSRLRLWVLCSDAITIAGSGTILSAKSFEDDNDNCIIGITVSRIFNGCDVDEIMVTQPAPSQYQELIKSLQENKRKVCERKKVSEVA